MEQKFAKDMWESVLERHFPCTDVEITSSQRLTNGWRGTFTVFSRVILGVECYYSFIVRDGFEMEIEKIKSKDYE